MSSPSSTSGKKPSAPARRTELTAFAGLPQALARLILNDGRSRKDVAEAAGLNASMLSGYCSGRRIPSLEHLDRLLTALEVELEDLTHELREVEHQSAKSPHALKQRTLLKEEEVAAATAMLSDMFDEMVARLQAENRAAGARPRPEPGKAPRRKRT